MQYKTNTPKILTTTETTKLLTETGRHEDDLRDHVLFGLALGCGLRLGELVGLNVGDIRNGKGAKSVIGLRPAITKGSKPGDVAVPERVRRKLRRFLSWKGLRGQSLADDAPLFCSRGGGRSRAKSGSRLSRRGAQAIFRRWQGRLGFDRSLHFHALRHSFATTLWRSTRDLRLVQIAARHANPSTTAVYTHPSLDDVAEAVQSLPC